ncbi:peptidase M20/M25/M40 family protein [Paraburkholderia xenovorans LB400]|uniref:Acetylornithine deacetylase n=1 Tax=Paraburkholderia xenovorans (strain LB400) TaxID=266265 RepID=Q13H60_PARXL|nr:hypothetical protein [Paraburkholderia xenovorans]ABE36579.1 hypothetical protein Bxe_C0681 [Paraburkholderia xenovorans LB400]AIP35003.1 peptidase M20/M25/M40 family protein [Paraburkholderia xenovorans LB400]
MGTINRLLQQWKAGQARQTTAVLTLPPVQRVFDIVEDITGTRPAVGTAPYFSDASALQPLINGAPTLILGPGELTAMHQTDEYCEVVKLRDAVRIYEALIHMSVDADARLAALPAVAEE